MLSLFSSNIDFSALCHDKKGKGVGQGVKGMDRIAISKYAVGANTAYGEDHVTQPGHSEIASSTPLLLVYY